MVRDQFAHPAFSSFWDRLGGEVLELAERAIGRPGDRPWRIVEPACGEGFLGAAIERVAQRRGLEVAYTGSDLSASAVDLAREEVKGTLLAGDATEVVGAMAPGSQDVVVAKNLLHHIDDPQGFLAAAARAVGDQGCVVVVEARLGCPQCFAISLLDVRREKYFFRGRSRNLAAIGGAGLRIVAEERFNFLPYEIAFHIRPGFLRRLFGTHDRSKLDAAARLDRQLERRLPWLTHYVIWVLVPAGDPSDRP